MIKSIIDKDKIEIDIDFDRENLVDEIVFDMLFLNKAILYKTALKYLSNAPVEVQVKFVNMLKERIGELLQEMDAGFGFIPKCDKRTDFDA